MSSKLSAQEEQGPSNNEIPQLRQEVQLALEQRQASMMHAIRDMRAEFMKDNDRSESSGAEGRITVGNRPAGAGTTTVLTAVQETTSFSVV